VRGPISAARAIKAPRRAALLIEFVQLDLHARIERFPAPRCRIHRRARRQK
jgi:hypothetical protein